MVYHSWNKIKIKKQIKSTNDSVDKTILEHILNGSMIPFDDNAYPKTNDANKIIIDECSVFSNYIEEFSLTPKFKNVQQEQKRVPINLQLDFLYELFSSVTPEWMGIFNKIFKERKSNLKISSAGNYSVYLSSLDYSYISINKIFLIDDLFSLVHEYTHAIVDHIFYRMEYNSIYPFVELPSLNMELVSATLMSEFFLDIDSDIVSYFKYTINAIIDFAKRIVRISKYLNQSGEFPQYFNRSLIIDYSYVIPYLFNLELFSLYNEDKEKWFYILMEIINIQPSGNPLEDIKKLGLTPNFKVNEICDELRAL